MSFLPGAWLRPNRAAPRVSEVPSFEVPHVGADFAPVSPRGLRSAP